NTQNRRPRGALWARTPLDFTSTPSPPRPRGAPSPGSPPRTAGGAGPGLGAPQIPPSPDSQLVPTAVGRGAAPGGPPGALSSQRTPIPPKPLPRPRSSFSFCVRGLLPKPGCKTPKDPKTENHGPPARGVGQVRGAGDRGDPRAGNYGVPGGGRPGVPGREGAARGSPGGRAACRGQAEFPGIAGSRGGRLRGHGDRQHARRDTGSRGDRGDTGVAADPRGTRGARAAGPGGGARPQGGAGVAGGQRGRARPEECGRPGSPGPAAAPVLPARGRAGWVGVGTLQVRAGAAARRGPRSPPSSPRPRSRSNSCFVSLSPHFSRDSGRKWVSHPRAAQAKRGSEGGGPPPAQRPQPGQGDVPEPPVSLVGDGRAGLARLGPSPGSRSSEGSWGGPGGPRPRPPSGGSRAPPLLCSLPFSFSFLPFGLDVPGPVAEQVETVLIETTAENIIQAGSNLLIVQSPGAGQPAVLQQLQVVQPKQEPQVVQIPQQALRVVQAASATLPTVPQKPSQNFQIQAAEPTPTQVRPPWDPLHGVPCGFCPGFGR
uniref:SP2 factor n=1 Tax=Junco hyemalis TaxID=40217 RepID=A0A8C5IXA9_JUNHY